MKFQNKKNKVNKHGMIKIQISGWLVLLPAVLIMYLFIWRGTVMGAVWSFYEMRGFHPVGFAGLKNYIQVVNDSQFLPIIFNTVKYVVLSLIVGFVPPILFAVMINEMVHFKQGLMTIAYLPAIIPAVAAMLMWTQMYDPSPMGLFNIILSKFGISPYGWLNDGRFTILYIIIYMTWKQMPGAILLYYASLQSVSSDLYEAAIIDNAGIFRRIWNVTLPQISGVLVLNFVTQIITIFQILDQPLAMTGGGPNGASISVGYQIYRYGFVTGRAGNAMALSVIIFILLMIITCFYFRLEKKISENY